MLILYLKLGYSPLSFSELLLMFIIYNILLDKLMGFFTLAVCVFFTHLVFITAECETLFYKFITHNSGSVRKVLQKKGIEIEIH